MRPTVPEGVAGLSADNPGAGFLIYHLDKPTWSTGFLVTQNVKNLPAVQDSIPRLGRFPGGRHGYPLQDSCLGNSMERGAWWATVQGVAKNRT